MAGYSSSRLILQPLLNPWFIFCACTCAVVEALKKFNVIIPYLHYWLNDLLALPVILSLTVAIKRGLSQTDFKLSNIQIIIIFLYISLIFELALPYFSSKYTADAADIFCYGAGAAFYASTMKK